MSQRETGVAAVCLEGSAIRALHLLVVIAVAGCAAEQPTPSLPLVSASTTPAVSRSPTPTILPTETLSPSVVPTSVTDGTYTVAGLLALLPIAPEDRTGYSRALFRHWIDADGNGCNTRKEVLTAEAVVALTIGPGCALSDGHWFSAYDGVTFTDPSGLDIDHMVPLAEAWDSGAYGWDAARRQAFANDLGVPWALIAVSAASNRSKGDKDPAEWLPPRAAFVCQYVDDWLAVKARWGLSLDPAEEEAIVGHSECSDTEVTVILVE